MTDRAFQIIDYLQSTTLDNIPLVGSNVFLGSANLLDKDDLPVACISLGENITLGDQGRMTTGFVDRQLIIRINIAVLNSEVKKYSQLNEVNASVYKAMMSGYTTLKSDLTYVLDYWLSVDYEPSINVEPNSDLYTQEILWVFHYRHSIDSTEV